MNKRLVCLTLSILMLLTCLLASCNSEKKESTEGGEEAVVDNSAKTITLWVIADEATLADGNAAADRVEKAFTKITKAKFRTNVVLKFCTEAEYYEK